MSEFHDEVARRLNESGQRYTEGRRRLVAALTALGRPATIKEIVASDPGLAQSSAYRNLEVLQASGVVHRIASPGDFDHFELSEPLLGHHHHLICVQCGSIADVHLPDELEHLVDQKLNDAAKQAGFRPTHHSIDLHGFCLGCDAPSK